LVASSISSIFLLGQQVNYWLQKFKFYYVDDQFIKDAAPKKKGLTADPPYYDSAKKNLHLICGKRFDFFDQYTLIPMIPLDEWPLHGKSKSIYKKCFIECINYFKKIEV
jgi:hypothetical protein